MMPIPLHLARSDKICVVIRRTISLLQGPFKQDTMCTAQISREETHSKLTILSLIGKGVKEFSMDGLFQNCIQR